MDLERNCVNCGTALEPGGRFCPKCGTRVESVSEAPVAQELPEAQEASGAQAVPEDRAIPEARAVPVPKKAFKPLYLGGAVIAAVAAIAGAAIFLGRETGVKTHIIYGKDKELQYASLPEGGSFAVTEHQYLSGDEPPGIDLFCYLGYFVFTSDNGQYLYYPDGINDDSWAYYWRDVKEKGQKGKAAEAVRIDTDIVGFPWVTKDGNKVFYMKDREDRRLYVYDRKSGEKGRLDDHVNDMGDINAGLNAWFVNDTGDYIIYAVKNDDEDTLYEMSVSGIAGEKNKIDSNAHIEKVLINEKKIYYRKDGKLYLKESGKDKIKIASEVRSVVSVAKGSAVYYTKGDEIRKKLSDFIIDDMFEADQQITKPEVPEYPEEPAYPRSSDYYERTWVASYWGSEFDVARNEWGNWEHIPDYEAYEKAYAQYDEDMAAWAEETSRMDEVYKEAIINYEGKGLRDELRTALSLEENNIQYTQYDLYYWTPAGETLVSKDVDWGSICTPADSDDPWSSLWHAYFGDYETIGTVTYGKYDTPDVRKKKLSEILANTSGTFDVGYIMSEIRSAAYGQRKIQKDDYIALEGKENILMSGGFPVSEKFDDDGNVYFIDNSDKGHRALMSVSVSGGTVTAPVKIDEDVIAFVLGNGNHNVYYLKGAKKGPKEIEWKGEVIYVGVSWENTGDLYMDGELLATDVYWPSLYNYKGSDTLLYCSDFSYERRHGTLCMFKGGVQTKISDDVNCFWPVDEKNIAYMTDYNFDRSRGELLLYSEGKKPTPIDSDVNGTVWDMEMLWRDYQWTEYEEPCALYIE